MKSTTTDTLRTASQRNWICETEGGIKEIAAGSLQRIADAMEKQAEATNTIAANWQRLTDERDMYKRWHSQQKEMIQKRDRRISALHGVITKLKNKNRKS